MSKNQDFRSIVADSGPLNIEYGYEITVIDIPHLGSITLDLPFPNPEKTQDRGRLDGFTDDQWDWIQDTAEGQDHVFFFTHGRVVGGGEEQRGRMVDHTEEFVEWANRPWVNMEAVFVGHGHVNDIYEEVHIWDIDDPIHELEDPEELHIMEFMEPTYYIETEASTGG